MGKQHNVYFIGRQENIVYYQWLGGYYMRTKSSLDGKRFHKDPAFARSRQRAVEFGVAAKLAAEVYQLLPKELKKRGMIGRLTGWAHRGLMAGESREKVILAILEACGLAEGTARPKRLEAACTSGPSWIRPAVRKAPYTDGLAPQLTKTGQLLLQRIKLGPVVEISPLVLAAPA